VDGVTKHGIPFFAKPVSLKEILDAVQSLVAKGESGSTADSQ
jgi:hypothetical protein